LAYVSLRRRSGFKDPDLVAILIKQLGISPLTAQLAIARGAKDAESAERYLHPSLKGLHSPWLLDGMDEAVSLIKSAAAKGANMMVIGDYDCDGICGAAILSAALSKLGARHSVYLPNRFSDGYGVNTSIVEKAASDGVSLILTVDNGISAHEAVQAAGRHGIDFVITDHHTPPKALPAAHAILNPKLEGSGYPYKELCGASVALKLAMALCEWDEAALRELISLAAVATIADVVSLTGENRDIASLGLAYISEGACPGLWALARQAGLEDGKVRASFVSFQIAPRLNAPGRLDSAMLSYELLTTKDVRKRASLAGELSEMNRTRQEEEAAIIQAGEEFVAANGLTDTQRVLFILLPDAHEGVIGIAAGKLAEEYARPCVVACERDGMLKASARSGQAGNIYELLSAAEGCFETFGGHAQAAGITMRPEMFAQAAELVNLAAEKAGLGFGGPQNASYDIVAGLANVSEKVCEEIELMAPFGVGNPRPNLLIENVLLQNLQAVGKTKEHARCEAISQGLRVPAIAFGQAEALAGLVGGGPMDIVASPQLNTFRGKTTLQLELKTATAHLACPKEYDFSLYEQFYAFMEGIPPYLPPDFTGLSCEGALEQCEGSSPLFVAYGRDTLMRCLRYASEKGYELDVAYSRIVASGPKACLLVNPVEGFEAGGRDIYVLDMPCFGPYDARVYEGLGPVHFLRGGQDTPAEEMSRTTIAWVYKSLPALPALGESLERFTDYVNSKSPEKASLFTILLCLDILSELDIISYSTDGETLQAFLPEAQEQKNLFSSRIMLELKGTKRQESTQEA